MQKVNLEKLQAEAKERHKHRQRKPYTKKPKQEIPDHVYKKYQESDSAELNYSIQYP